jgi:diguanylate cyclase (GGDEF)-like protein/PAS domain S-box-containing protein
MRKIFNVLADRKSRRSLLTIGIFLALLLAAPIVGYGLYTRQMSEQETHAKESLSRIAQIRAATTSSFIHERTGDALLVVSSPFLQEAIRSWMQQDNKDKLLEARLRERINALKRIYGYLVVAILDTRGNTVISTDTTARPVDDFAADIARRAADSNTLLISSIHSRAGPTKDELVVDISVPLFPADPRTGIAGAILLMRFDPRQQIYPSIQTVPFPNLPNDALLVEIRGQQVVSLSDSRSGRYRYLDRLPISPAQLLDSASTAVASLAWQDKESNEKIIASAHAVDGVPWFVVALANEDSVHAAIRNTALVAATASGVMLCILSIGILLWWKYKESEFKVAALETEAERRLLQKQYDYLSKYANDMIILTDADHRILEVNDKTLQVLGFSADLLAGQPFDILCIPAGRDRLQAHLNTLRREGTAMFEISQERSDGTVFPVEVNARSIDFEGRFFNQFICRDITERKEAESRIQSLAYYDNVTSLPNRTLLNDRLDQAIHMAARSAKKVGVLFLDLDNFKNINDTLGHQTGDMLLRSVGQRLLDCVREEDTVARIGGDEFLILLPDLDRGDEALRVAEKVIASIARPYLLSAQQIHTTTSIGISLFPDDSATVTDLVKYADSALYEAKSRGRNNYQFFTRELNEQITRASRIEQYLRDAMEGRMLRLWYQPQIDVRTGKVIGAEALLRWHDGNHIRFSPADAISVAEERGLIIRLGEWTLREACRQCRLWQSKGLPAVPVAVNVSPIQLQQKKFTELVLDALHESGLDAAYLELEITETSIMQKAQAVADLAMRLRDSGVRISIDDFGTGYSNLSYLKHIPIDKIKIDRSFVHDMLEDAEDEAITEAIVRLGQSLQLRVIAEGVESRAQMERLFSLGCHEVQGFLYSRAVSSEIFQGFLAKEWHFAEAAATRQQLL